MASGGMILCACCMLFLYILLAVLQFGISIAQIVIGAKYKSDCPAERMIPIYLIVSGSFGLFQALFFGHQARRSRSQQTNDEVEEQEQPNKGWEGFKGLVNLFMFIWLCLGFYWVFHIQSTVSLTDVGSANYCAPTMYIFAKVILSIVLVIMAILTGVCILTCCGACCVACFSGTTAATSEEAKNMQTISEP